MLRDLTLFSFICISGKDPFNETLTLKAAGIKHGDMLYITVNEEKTGIHEAAASSLKKITKDGTIVAQGILIYSLVIMLLTLLTLFIDYSSIASSNILQYFPISVVKSSIYLFNLFYIYIIFYIFNYRI